MNVEVYATAASSMAPLLAAVEENIQFLPNNSIVSAEVVASFNIPFIYNPEQLAGCLKALSAIGILTKNQDAYRLNSEGVTEGLALARGIRFGISWHSQLESDTTDLCVALPVGLTNEIENYFRERALDLRASIVDLISSADQKLILVSPFWDYETARDLCELVSRRMDAGVFVDILGRFDSADDPALALLRERLADHPQCRVFRWSRQLADDRFGQQTFHFKSISVDHGVAAYVGSANFTAAGLRSRMELGLRLRGPIARQVDSCLAQVINLAVLT